MKNVDHTLMGLRWPLETNSGAVNLVTVQDESMSINGGSDKLKDCGNKVESFKSRPSISVSINPPVQAYPITTSYPFKHIKRKKALLLGCV